jgi:hypothetical protein
MIGLNVRAAARVFRPLIPYPFSHASGEEGRNKSSSSLSSITVVRSANAEWGFRGEG